MFPDFSNAPLGIIFNGRGLFKRYIFGGTDYEVGHTREGSINTLTERGLGGNGSPINEEAFKESLDWRWDVRRKGQRWRLT